MSLTSYLRYWYLSLRYPKLRDFISGGLGIEARAKRVSHLWRNHLKNCKDFQTKELQNHHDISIAILGAGRLYDVAVTDLLSSCARITLFDADPGCLTAWKKLREQALKKNISTSFSILDIMDTLDMWTQRIMQPDFTYSEEELTATIHNLPTPSPILLKQDNFDVIVSLNLLSQIPLYWEDRLLAQTKEKTRPLSKGFQSAVQNSMRLLQLAHLKQLNDSAAKVILLITDKSFLYYLPNKSEWQEELAVPLQLTQYLTNYTCTYQESWFWHIAPYGIENQDHGAIHDVIALRCERH